MIQIMKHVTTALCRLLERLHVYLISSVTLCRAVEIVNCCLSTTVNDKIEINQNPAALVPLVLR